MEREETLWSLINATRETLLLTDTEGRILVANETVARRLGKSVQELIGTSQYDHLPPDVARKRKEQYDRVVRTGQTISFQDENRGRFYDVSAQPVFDDAGNVSKIAIYATDVSVLKRSEETLRKINACLLTLGNDYNSNIQRFVALCGDLLGATCALYNRLERGMLCSAGSWNIPSGYNPEDRPEGHICYDVITRSNDGVILVRDLLHTPYAESDPNVREYGLQTYLGYVVKCQERRVGSLCVVYQTDFSPADDDIRVMGIIASALGNEESRRESEETLRVSEEKYRNIFENAVEGIFQTAPDGRIISANPALARINGYTSPEEMIRETTDLNTVLYADESCRSEFIRLMNEKGDVRNFEARARGRNGAINWVSVNARNVRDVNGKTLYYEGTLENITERKHLESQLLQSHKMEAIGTLAGGVAHDFNNILTAIIGYSNLLQIKINEDDPLRTYVNRILASSQKAVNLTQSLLAFSRKQPIELKPHRVNTLIAGITKILKRLLTEDIALDVVLADTDLTIMADTNLIDQVMMNLAANGRDAMPKGGSLIIETKGVEIDGEFIGTRGHGEHGRYAQISVIDTGTGMDGAIKEKIFEPFFTTKEEGKGTGLGLSMVYGIITQHNGFINVDSIPGKGTAFRMYFPAVEIEEAPEAEGTPLNIKAGTETILLAEDNPEVRNFMKEILEMAGYDIVEALDGEDALGKFMDHRDRVALLVLDVVMPGRNGKDVHEEIRKVKPDIKALFTSGYTKDVLLVKGVHNEAADFISKPLSPDVLLLKVREMLDK